MSDDDDDSKICLKNEKKKLNEEQNETEKKRGGEKGLCKVQEVEWIAWGKGNEKEKITKQNSGRWKNQKK